MNIYSKTEFVYYQSRHAYLQADAAVQRNLDRIRVVAGLHQGGEVTDADLLQRRLAAPGDAHIGQTLAQRVRAAQQDVVVDLVCRRRRMEWPLSITDYVHTIAATNWPPRSYYKATNTFEQMIM